MPKNQGKWIFCLKILLLWVLKVVINVKMFHCNQIFIHNRYLIHECIIPWTTWCVYWSLMQYVTNNDSVIVSKDHTRERFKPKDLTRIFIFSKILCRKDWLTLDKLWVSYFFIISYLYKNVVQKVKYCLIKGTSLKISIK